MKVFKASYSTLSQWAAGNIDTALEMYFGVSDYDNEAMQLGRALHTEWEREIKATKCMPQVFGGRKLNKGFKCEVFAYRKLTDWLVLRGKLDLLEGFVGHDWKTGVTPSTQWANSFQHKVYQLLYPKLRRFEYHAFNPYAKAGEAVSVSIVHLTPKTQTDAAEWLVTHASEMKDYIEKNELEAHFAQVKADSKVAR